MKNESINPVLNTHITLEKRILYCMIRTYNILKNPALLLCKFTVNMPV